jgi:hypothetical protein
MRRRILAMAALTAALALGATVPAVVGGRTTNMLDFERMASVPTAYTGTKAPIRGLNGGGLPWVIGSAKGEVGVDGSLELKFSGLVLDPNDPATINAGNAGTNPVASMRAIVSCQSVDTAGAANVVNVQTATFPVTTGTLASGAGTGRVEARLSLPTPCIAPIVFITTPGGAWFAATGR